MLPPARPLGEERRAQVRGLEAATHDDAVPDASEKIEAAQHALEAARPVDAVPAAGAGRERDKTHSSTRPRALSSLSMSHVHSAHPSAVAPRAHDRVVRSAREEEHVAVARGQPE